ncbi:GH25 family lysozyme [Acinetobacter sp. SAAs470]|uniref:glycoside hydrolase family 25 protein n=1 Tax=unclassified Acinetobacter TaxID=196816 RepID=UPI0039775DCA
MILKSKTLLGSLLGCSFMGLSLIIYMVFFQNHIAAASEYKVQGFDVSHHQGNIAWHKISLQNYAFVYLKATEGGDFQDRKFQDNWLQAREQGLLVGAYHFYRLCRNGSIQAENFIHTVPKKADALPPVIDLEYDSDCINTFTKQQLLQEIQIMHDQLYQHYGKAPIFYTSKAFYNIVLAGEFQKTPLWIREYNGQPNLKGEPDWLFWQHTNQAKITGINTTVDLNVFNGDMDDWLKFLEKNQLSPPSKIP